MTERANSAVRPILWTFRRCPYAMRARLAVHASGVEVELREILLRDKPAAFLSTSPSGTVPCLQDGSTIIDESRDIMLWALRQSDPRGWLARHEADAALIDVCDGPFKTALDHVKYHVRFPDLDLNIERQNAGRYLAEWDARIARNGHLTGPSFSLADAALAPFVRQFANNDMDWFRQQPWPHLTAWLDHFTASADFAAIMPKYPLWTPGAPPLTFPA